MSVEIVHAGFDGLKVTVEAIVSTNVHSIPFGTVTCRLEILLEIALGVLAGACPGKGDPIWYSMELQNQPWRTENGQTEGYRR